MNNKNFCLQPWIGIHAWPDGSVFPCCMYSTKQPLGNINNEPIQELVNNEKYKDLRKELLENKKPEGCSRCYKLEESGIQTLRKTTSEQYPEYQEEIIKSQKITMSEVRYLDIRFSNICNFKCRTCGPELSNKWGAEMTVLKNESNPGIIQIPRENFWNYYEQALETAYEVVFAGGEALMQEEHYAALEKLIELKKFDIKIYYTTNLSTLKYKQKDLFDLWSKFTNIHIYASLDASGSRAEYIRKGTLWKTIVENRKKISQLPELKFFITPTISLYNVWHFPDFYKEWVTEGLLDPANIRLNILTHPTRQQANILENKKEIIDKWTDLILWIIPLITDKEKRRDVIQQFNGVIKFLKTDPKLRLKLVEEFINIDKRIDWIRKEDFFEVFPELINHLKIPSIKSKTFCIYPFYNLNSNTDGSVKLCCNIRDNDHIKKPDGTEYNLGKDSINEIWNSEYISDVRHKMLTGEQVPECKDCYRHEEMSGSSSRTQSNMKYIDTIQILESVDEYLTTEEISLKNLKSLELRLGNTCNLSCNSCWGYSSSKVNEERIRILKKEETNLKYQKIWNSELAIPNDINQWFKRNQYKENLKTVSGNLERIYLTGGEPTLIKENRILLQYLIDTGNTNCFVSFTTNGTIVDDGLMDLMKHFHNSEIQISIDGIGDQANYIRYPVKWTEFDNNVNKLLSLSKTKIVFYTVVSAYNLFSINEIMMYIDKLAQKKHVGWFPIFLDNPSSLRTQIWPSNIRMDALDKFKLCVDNLEVLRQYVKPEVFYKVYEYYSSNEELNATLTDFVEFNSLLDKHRGTNFNRTFPELSCLI